MRSSASLLLLSTALSSPAFAVGGGGGGGEHEQQQQQQQRQRQCFGYTPQPSVSTFLGASLDYSTAERICCNNHRYAEYAGYLAAPEVDLFGRLDPNGGETVFYDSVCGLPLFVAPRGRSFGEFRDESLKHGWPSFRPEEIISENVIIHGDGRMESRCLTHLGHNLPSGGIDRYCIDLVCVAGAPLTIGDSEDDDERAEILRMIDNDGLLPAILHGEEFNATSYTSSAEDFSGKYNDWSMMVVVGFVVLVMVVGVGTMVYFGAGHMRKKRRQASTLTTTTDQSKGGVDRLGTGASVDTDGSDGGVYNTVQLSEEQ